MSHTPTPWTCNALPAPDHRHVIKRQWTSETGCRCTTYLAEIYTQAPGGEPQQTEAAANAAHIVRCVNAHDELVKALRYVLEDDDGLLPRATSECRRIARAALRDAS